LSNAKKNCNPLYKNNTFEDDPKMSLNIWGESEIYGVKLKSAISVEKITRKYKQFFLS
jgi:hypothetical protein